MTLVGQHHLNLGTGLPIVGQSVGLVTRRVLSQIKPVVLLQRDFVVRIVLSDRSVYQIVKNPLVRFFLDT